MKIFPRQHCSPDWTLVTPKTTRHSVVVVPARRAGMKWQNRVAREIGRNGLCRRRMNLHHFVGVGEDRFRDSVGEGFRQIGARDCEIIDSESLIVAP